MPERIVYIVESLYKPDYIQKIHCHQINWMAENSEYEVYAVLTEKPHRQLVYELSPKVHIVNFGLNFDDINKFYYYQKPFLSLKKQWAYRKKMKKLLENIRPKAIITYDKREKWCLWSISDKSHKIVVLGSAKDLYKKVWITNLPLFVNWTATFFKRNLHTLPLKAMDTVVVETQDSQKSWRQIFPKIVAIRPPIIDFPENPVSKENCKVIVWGDFVKGSRFDLLIHAWEKIGRYFPNWRLQLCGNGDQEPYKKIIREKRLSKLILCYSQSENRSEKYSQSAILVHTSENDIYGGAIMEAMAYGIPCVVMKVPGTPNELIKNEENGFLIKPDHLMDLTIKLSILIRNADYRQKLGSKARENMRIYNLDTTMKRWLKLLDEIETKKKHK